MARGSRLRWIAPQSTKAPGGSLPGLHRQLLDKRAKGIVPDEADFLPTRFTFDGDPVAGDWWDFQLDGYGAWLWALVQHVRRTGDSATYDQSRAAVDLMVRYLATLWQQPNYDCWEENRQHIHVSTLAALYGGLHAVNEFDPSPGLGAL